MNKTTLLCGAFCLCAAIGSWGCGSKPTDQAAARQEYMGKPGVKFSDHLKQMTPDARAAFENYMKKGAKPGSVANAPVGKQ